jgi:hypothetical protein
MHLDPGQSLSTPTTCVGNRTFHAHYVRCWQPYDDGMESINRESHSQPNVLCREPTSRRLSCKERHGHMKKPIVATFFLLFWAMWAIAQQNKPGQAHRGSSGQTTIQGCLGRSDGGYTLTDKSGTAYQLSGETAQLSDHVGHTVQIKGTMVDSGATPGTPSSTNTGTAQPDINVSSVKHISETCGSSKNKSENSPMSEKPPQ